MMQTICRSWAGHSSIGPKLDFVQSTSRTNCWNGVRLGGGGVAVQSNLRTFFLDMSSRGGWFSAILGATLRSALSHGWLSVTWSGAGFYKALPPPTYVCPEGILGSGLQWRGAIDIHAPFDQALRLQQSSVNLPLPTIPIGFLYLSGLARRDLRIGPDDKSPDTLPTGV